MRQLGIAMHNYHNDYRCLPPAAICDPDGQPLLSWRVLLLPYLEEETLFKDFKLDEPWDSPHNIQLLARMPKVYKPVRKVEAAQFTTFYQVFTGPGTAFERGRKLSLKEITAGDGTSNTALIVEAWDSVPWTQPADLEFAPDGPLPALGGIFRDDSVIRSAARGHSPGFFVVFADCSTRYCRQLRSPQGELMMKSLITWNGKEQVDVSPIMD